MHVLRIDHDRHCQPPGIREDIEGDGDVAGVDGDRDDPGDLTARQVHAGLRTPHVGLERVDEVLARDERLERAHRRQAPEHRREQGCRGAACPLLEPARLLGDGGQADIAVLDGGHPDRDDPRGVPERARLALGPRGYGNRDDELAHPLAPAGQEVDERAGHGDDDEVVDADAATAGPRVQGLEVDLGEVHPPVPTRRPKEAAAVGAARTAQPELGDRRAQATHRGRHAAHRGQPLPPGVGGQGRRVRHRAGRLRRGKAGGLVDERRQDRQPAHAVGDDVVQDDGQPDSPSGPVLEDPRLPQRPVAGQPSEDEVGRGPQTRVVGAATGLRAGDEVSDRRCPDMAVEGETGVVGPDGPAAPRRRADQPLAQPAYSRHPVGEDLPQGGGGRGTLGRELEQRPDVHRHAAPVDGERHEVAAAGPVDGRGWVVDAHAPHCRGGRQH